MVKRIMILTPDLSLSGGVATYYRGMLKHWTMDVKYYISLENKNDNKILDLFRFIGRCFSFWFALVKNRPDLVVFNASLKKGFNSNLPYASITKLFGRKVVLFIRGWDEKQESLLTTRPSKLFLKKTDACIVLSKQFKAKLEQYGYNKPIFLSSTKVEDDLVKGFDINQRQGKIEKFLFSARLSKAKGVMEMLDTYQLLSQKHPSISLDIVGTGDCDEEAKQYVNEHDIQNVRFHGWLSGEDLARFYRESDFFFFLSYTEGMPASVLEAMAFGLPIATRPVGATPDFFTHGINGILSESLDPEYYFEEIEKLMQNPERVKEISNHNYQYANEHFLASVVAKNLEEIFKKI